MCVGNGGWTITAVVDANGGPSGKGGWADLTNVESSHICWDTTTSTHELQLVLY